MKTIFIFAIFVTGVISMLAAPKLKAESVRKTEKATFAGGCFWCMESPFDEIEGVISTTVGYTGGQTENPTYEEVCTGRTGHAEAVEIVFDPSETDYRTLLAAFWRNIDPTTRNRQFADAGSQYRTAIFYHSEEQKRLAEASKQELEASGRFKGKKIVTEIVPATAFYRGEEYHQDYYRKNPFRFNLYKKGSGRADYIEKTWGKDKK